MSRRTALATLGSSVLAGPRRSMAQTATRTPRIGLLSVGSDPASPLPPQWVAFTEALAALGYVDGRTVIIERRFSGGQPERLAGFAEELVKLKSDVIVVTGTREVQAAKRATTTIPIVTVVAPDPVEAGIAASLARPGGNITGLTFTAPGIGQKYVELLKQTSPASTRVAVIASRPQAAALRREIDDAAQALHVTVLPTTLITRLDALDPTLAAAKRDGVSGLIVPSDGFMNANRPRVVELVAKYALPTIYAVRQFVESGGLMSYGPSFFDLFRRAATFADKILKGARPSDLPMEQPTKFELVLNARTARTLRLTFPPMVTARADEIVE